VWVKKSHAGMSAVAAAFPGSGRARLSRISKAELNSHRPNSQRYAKPSETKACLPASSINQCKLAFVMVPSRLPASKLTEDAQIYKKARRKAKGQQTSDF
jgi:hypothetical protein